MSSLLAYVTNNKTAKNLCGRNNYQNNGWSWLEWSLWNIHILVDGSNCLCTFAGTQRFGYYMAQKLFIITRMHSSRMRTGRTLTVFRWRPPPRKIGDTPPKNLEEPPQKSGGPPWDQTPRRDQTPPVNRMNDRRLWKYYLGHTNASIWKQCPLI